MASSLETWALPRMQQLLPIDDESLKQIITYASILPKDAAAEHLKNLLGDDARSLEFITSFNQRRKDAPATSAAPKVTASSTSDSGVPRTARKPQKKKPQIHALPARQIEDHGDTSGAYQKRDQEDYMSAAPRQKPRKEQLASNLALQAQPEAIQQPQAVSGASSTAPTAHLTAPPPAPPSAAGSLISDALNPKRSKSPLPKARVTLTGGTAMHGASTALSDLDSAIRSLELQTNPTLTTSETTSDTARRTCNCMATRHPLLDIAPNCLSCGQIICVKQGLGPCTFCGTPLLDADSLQKVLRVLKDERGEERMRVNNAGHRKAEVAGAGKARAYTGREFLGVKNTGSAAASPLSSAAASEDEGAGDRAREHRDKLLGFQAQNARRTRIVDEAADFEVPTAGTNMWASPVERAAQLKRQQKVLREMEWNARPEWEKRKVVASIDVVGGKVVRRMAEVERPKDEEVEDEDNGGVEVGNGGDVDAGGNGAFSKNPLASGLVRPVAREVKGKDAVREKRSVWRRVQMDEDDNEQWILDGGAYGGQTVEAAQSDELACG